jgi:hypothetical protein
VPLADVYLESVGGRRRPNTVLAAASDLKVFFAVVDKPPDQVRLLMCWRLSPPGAPRIRP